MNNFDSADINGDGSFDALDIVITEEEMDNGAKQQEKGNRGYRLLLLPLVYQLVRVAGLGGMYPDGQNLSVKSSRLNHPLFHFVR